MTLRHPGRFLVAGLVLGWLFDLLFYGKLPGISLLAFNLVLLAALGWALHTEAAQVIRGNLWLPVLPLFFATMGFVRANGFLTFLNICAMLMILSLLAVHLTREPVAEVGLLRLTWAPVQALGLSLYRGGGVISQTTRDDLRAARGNARRFVPPILRGLLIALPVLIVFTALLASADLIFADLLRRVLAQDILEQLLRWGWRAVLILAVGFLLLGGLAYAVGRPRPDGENASANRIVLPTLPRFLGCLESGIVINAVNVLFFLFVLIQLPYLFGGQINIAAGRFTYAEYARRGFGELIAASILVLGMILALSAITRREGRRQRLGFNISSTILVTLTCVMLVSAFKRLLLYENFYGFTEMRLYPHVFMVWLGLLLAWFVATLWVRPDRFAIGLLIAAFGFIITLDLLNPEAFIVRQNFARYQQQGESAFTRSADPGSNGPGGIDAAYLARFSDDAVPALIQIVDRLPAAERQVVDERLLSLGRQRFQQTEWRRWQSFHLARWTAYRWLTARYDASTLSVVETHSD